MNKEIIKLPSGVTKSIYGLDIDVNIQGNNVLSFGPYFYKSERVRMFDTASNSGLPMAGFLGNLQCSGDKTCIIAEDACKCDPATHDCLCESTNITDLGISLPYSQGPFTVYEDKKNERDKNIKWSYKIFNKERKKLDMTISKDLVIEKEKVLSDILKAL